MPDIVIKDEYGDPETYYNVNTVKFKTPDDSTASFKYNPGTEYPYQDGQYRVRFLDYDGEVVKVQWVDAGESASYPTTNPQHTGLTFVGWNYSLAQLSSINGDIDVGALYRSSSAPGSSNTSTIIVMELLGNVSLTSKIRLVYSGNLELVFDWGDGTIQPSSCTGGSSSGTAVSYTHGYANKDTYTITITKTSGSGRYWFGSGTSASSESYNICGGTGHNNVIAVTLSDDITKLAGGAFYNCLSIRSIVLPQNIQEIFYNVFDYCRALESIILPSSLTGQTSIKTNLFKECSSLKSVTISNGAIPYMQSNMFSKCYSLQSVTLPSSVNYIGGSVFEYCYSLKSVTIPSSVVQIAATAFYGCYSLKSITIPSSVTSIGNNAFQYCYTLKSMYLSSITPPTISSSLGIPSHTVIYVPNAAVSAYQTAWSSYASYIEGY